MNHMLFGALVPFVIAFIIYARRRFRASLRLLVFTPLAMIVSAVWAIVPDIPRLLGMQKLYLELSVDSRMNVFLFHHYLDQIEDTSAVWMMSSWIMVVVVALAAALFVAVLRELWLTERE